MKTKKSVREELIKQIDELPLFAKHKVRVSNAPEIENLEDDDWEEQKDFAICEVGKSRSYAYVGRNYKLLQFHEVFKPVLDSIEGNLHGYLYNGGGFAMLKIFPDVEQLKEENSQYGLIAINSVNLSTSIEVKFCIKHGERHFTVPAKVAGFKKAHKGDVKNLVKNYMSMIGKVKESWKTITEEFPKFKIVDDIKHLKEDELGVDFPTVVEKLNLGKRYAKKIKDEWDGYTKEGIEYTLWDAFLKIIDEISDRKYKTEAHMEKNIDKVCTAVFQYAMILSL